MQQRATTGKAADRPRLLSHIALSLVLAASHMMIGAAAAAQSTETEDQSSSTNKWPLLPSAVSDQTPMDVIVRPLDTEEAPPPTFDDAYIDLGDGIIITFGQWIRRRYGIAPDGTVDVENDRLDSLFNSGEGSRRLYGGTGDGSDGGAGVLADPFITPPERYMSARFKGMDFMSIAHIVGYDPDRRLEGYGLTQGILSFDVNPMSPHAETFEYEFGALEFGGGPKLRELMFRYR
ncbi:MAG: hypothetical protein AAGF15_05325 [Pseudomonadota bacterium]